MKENKGEYKIKDTILVISNASTSNQKPRGIQVQRLLKELSNYYEIILITSNHSIPDSSDYFNSKISKIFILSEINNLWLKLLSKIWSFFGSFDIIFALKAYTKAKIIINTHHIEKILCISKLYSNIFSGVLLKRKYKNLISLFSFYSDPITNNPYHLGIVRLNYILNLIEKYFMKNSDINIFPSKSMADYYISKYYNLKERIFYIPHSFESVDQSNLVINKNSKFHIIRYLGSINEHRNPFLLLDYYYNNLELFSKYNIKFEFYGKIQNRIKKHVAKYKSENVNFYDEIPYIETLSIQAKADIILVIDADFTPSLFLPSKLIEVLPYQKPIIILTTLGSESEYVGKLTGNYVFYYDDLKQFKKIIESIISITSHSQNISDFSIKNIGLKYAKCISNSYKL